jgi:hypothetical protein
MSTVNLRRAKQATLTDILEKLVEELDAIGAELKMLQLIHERLSELEKQQRMFFESVRRDGVKTRAV